MGRLISSGFHRQGGYSLGKRGSPPCLAERIFIAVSRARQSLRLFERVMDANLAEAKPVIGKI